MQFIVATDGRPFAYLQCYDLTAWNGGFGRSRPARAASTSSSASRTCVDRGHGSAFIRAFIDGLLAAGTPRVVTDPDPANARADPRL